MKKSKIIILVFVLYLFNSCGSFYQNDHIFNSTIGEVNGKEIVYDIYQTGIDNYRYEIYMLEFSDTTKLFVAYLNDATSNNSQFDLKENGNKIEMRINKNIGHQETVVNGKTFVLIGLE